MIRLAAAVLAATIGTSSFPRDDSAHPRYATESWVLAGRVSAAHGRSFNYALRMFRYAVPARTRTSAGPDGWQTNAFYAAMLTLTDDDRGTMEQAERQARDALGIGSAATDHLAVRVDAWVLASPSVANGPLRRIISRASNGVTAIDLAHDPGTAPAVRIGPGSSSYPHLATRGTIRMGGVAYAVAGTSRLDHEFGDISPPPGRDRFAFRLNDGRLVLLDAVPQRGVVIERGGHVARLKPSDFTICVRPGTVWRSPNTGVSYPSLWQIVIPSARLDVTLRPTVADQEIVPAAGGSSQWIGAVDVRDNPTGGTRSIGAGDVALIGYAAVPTNEAMRSSTVSAASRCGL